MRYRRRVQVVGGSTYVVSLPKEWVRDTGLKHGSEVVIEVMPDLTLRIYSGDKGGERFELETELEVSDDFELSVAMLIASYVVGYRKLTIAGGGCSPDRLEALVKRVTEITIGLEVIEKSERYAVLRCLADVSTLSLAEALNTLTRLTIRSFEDVEHMISTGDLNRVDEVLERDSLIDKLYLYGLRQLNEVLLGMTNYASVGLGSVAEVTYWAMIFRFLERIADHLATIAKNIKELRHADPATLLKYIKSLRSKYDEVTKNLLLKQKTEDLSKFGVLISELRGFEAEVGRDSATLGISTEDLIRISAHLRDIIELLIDMHALKKLLAEAT